MCEKNLIQVIHNWTELGLLVRIKNIGEWIFFLLKKHKGKKNNRIEKKKCALAGNRTRVNCLEGSYAHHYTTNAYPEVREIIKVKNTIAVQVPHRSWILLVTQIFYIYSAVCWFKKHLPKLFKTHLFHSQREWNCKRFLIAWLTGLVKISVDNRTSLY